MTRVRGDNERGEREPTRKGTLKLVVKNGIRGSSRKGDDEGLSMMSDR